MSKENLSEIALEYLAHKEGCQTDEKFMMQHKLCADCSECQDLKACWRNFLLYYSENVIVQFITNPLFRAV